MVEGELGQWQQGRPTIRGKRDVSGRQHGYEVILGRADGTLSGVGAVLVGGHKLKLLQDRLKISGERS